MTTTDKPTDVTLVSCHVCLKLVPVSEATVSEATDYFVNFCGLECYEQWVRLDNVPPALNGEPPS